MPDNPPIENVLEDECRRICQTLGIDTVQIVATDFNADTNKTMTYTAGFGNWFARRDSLFAFVDSIRQEKLEESDKEDAVDE